ncbi:MAG: hypothetical protein MZW92_33475 [Comamonadaceae bacterium]|nr:hypothetical protein [Comamonadaceae bacterium]
MAGGRLERPRSTTWPHGLQRVKAEHGAGGDRRARPRRTRTRRGTAPAGASWCAAWAASNIDFRLRQSDFTARRRSASARPWLGLPVAEIDAARPRCC